VYLNREVFTVVLSSTLLAHVFNSVASRLGVEYDRLNFFRGGSILYEQNTVGEAGIENGDSIDVLPELRIGKPVIYLFSPTPLEASVTLSLVQEWKLSVVYPVVPIKQSAARKGQKFSWEVQTKEDGSLTELNTGLDVSYLFWEAMYVSSSVVSLAFLKRIFLSDLIRLYLFPRLLRQSRPMQRNPLKCSVPHQAISSTEIRSFCLLRLSRLTLTRP
jgi:hypothetical protein